MLIHPYTILEMMHQTAIVQIDGTHNTVYIIGDINLSMDKARLILVNLYTGIH